LAIMRAFDVGSGAEGEEGTNGSIYWKKAWVRAEIALRGEKPDNYRNELRQRGMGVYLVGIEELGCLLSIP